MESWFAKVEILRKEISKIEGFSSLDDSDVHRLWESKAWFPSRPSKEEPCFVGVEPDCMNQKHDSLYDPRKRNHALWKSKYWWFWEKKSVKMQGFSGFDDSDMHRLWGIKSIIPFMILERGIMLCKSWNVDDFRKRNQKNEGIQQFWCFWHALIVGNQKHDSLHDPWKRNHALRKLKCWWFLWKEIRKMEGFSCFDDSDVRRLSESKAWFPSQASTRESCFGNVEMSTQKGNHALGKSRYRWCFDRKSAKWADFDGFSKFSLFCQKGNHAPWFPVQSVRYI